MKRGLIIFISVFILTFIITINQSTFAEDIACYSNNDCLINDYCNGSAICTQGAGICHIPGTNQSYCEYFTHHCINCSKGCMNNSCKCDSTNTINELNTITLMSSRGKKYNITVDAVNYTNNAAGVFISINNERLPRLILGESYNLSDGSEISMLDVIYSAKESTHEPEKICFNYAVNSNECYENWSCTSWSNCSNSTQTRTCTDTVNCGTTNNRPSITQSCTGGVCNENWSCTSWSNCSNSTQTRTCIDDNLCGNITNKPPVTQNCTSQNVTNQTITSSVQNNVSTKPDVYILAKKITVDKNANGKDVLKIDNKDFESLLKIIEESSKVYAQTSDGTKKEIKILPEEAKSKATKVKEFKDIKINEEKGKAVYVVSGTKKSLLFFIIPMTVDVEQNIDVNNGNVVSTKKPWWHYFALGI